MERSMTTAHVDRVWELMESVIFCMLSNWDGTRIHSRPMGACVRRKEGVIYFFTDARSHKDDEIQQFPKICMGFADTHKQKYVSVSGTAQLIFDREKVDELWSAPAKVWWKTPENPDIRLLRVVPEEAEYWDAPGNLISDFKVAFAMITGGYPDAGEHKKIDL
jgi:general stress protein 26